MLLGAVLLAGCGNDPNPQPLHRTRPDGSPWIVYYHYLPDEVRSLDPQVTYDQVSRRVLEPVVDTLLEYHPMKTDPYTVAPCLLEAVPERTSHADGTVTYSCQLKRGVFYHDDPCFPGGKGRELVAADVHFAFQRLCDPAVETPIFNNLAEYVAGMNEAYTAAKQNGGRLDYDRTNVGGIEVIDSHRFKVHLLQPYPQILYWMAMHFTAPVPREAVAYYDGRAHPDGPRGQTVVRPLFKFHPVGNGPFKIAEWIRGQRFRFVRNEGYHTTTFPTEGWPPEREAVNRPLAGKPLPLVDELQFTVFRELLPIWLLTRQGYLDEMGVQKDAVNSLVTATSELSPKFAARGMALDKAVDVSTFYLSFNMQDPVIGRNKKLRQALSCAYDPQGYSNLLYGGVAPVAQQLLSPGIFGHQRDFRNPYGPNLDKARQLMAEAGYPGGRDPNTGQALELTMDTTSTGAEERQLAEYEQRQLEQLGIRVRVIENTFARMLEKQDQGNFQIAAGTGWGADYPDPENYFFLFTSNNFPPTGKNISRYENEEFDRLFAQMATMENTPERMAIIRRMNDLLIEDCPNILNFHKAYYLVIQPWAPRTHENTMLERGFKYYTTDPVLREQKRREWNPIPAWPMSVPLGVLVAGLGYGIFLNRRRNV
ncbi:MAG: ABC transporter substrate-binding protein [Verrucomicrobiota bacterium]|nr:ABC transporter substrate-binding protein [Verrucomicrobiota bacterium]